MQDNTKNRAAMASPRIRATQVLMSAFNVDGMDGGRMDTRIVCETINKRNSRGKTRSCCCEQLTKKRHINMRAETLK